MPDDGFCPMGTVAGLAAAAVVQQCVFITDIEMRPVHGWPVIMYDAGAVVSVFKNKHRPAPAIVFI